MKRFHILWMAMLLIFGTATMTLANEIGIFGGTPIPNGQTADQTHGQKRGGWQVGLQYYIPLRESLSCYFELDYAHIPNREDYDWLSPMKLLEGAFCFKVHTCNRYEVKPYILMGAGLAEINFLIDYDPVHVTSSSTELAVRLGGGLDYTASDRLSVFAEAMLWESHYQSLIPVHAGIRFAL